MMLNDSFAHALIYDAETQSTTSPDPWSIANPLALQDQEESFSSWFHRAYFSPAS